MSTNKCPFQRGRLSGPTNSRSGDGVSLIELLCCLAIIGILMSMLLPVVTKAYTRARSKIGEIEVPIAAERVSERCLDYCAANPSFSFTNKSDFAAKCGLDVRTQEYFKASNTEFVPFHFRSPTNLVVLTWHYGKNNRLTISHTKERLTVRREQ